jgi:hypothetical protein
MGYGKMVMELMSGLKGRGLGDFLPSASSLGWSESEGGGGEERDAGVLSWLSRLLGVEGKSLGEFLREYQVHVLYDLAFTFFKWIFFLYAGLLIP